MKRLEPHVLRLLELTAAIVIPLTFLLFVRVYVLCPDGEYDSDSFYHAAMAEFGPEFFAAKEFPNVTLSVWQERFSDKELGFHLLLWGMFRVNDWLGFGNAPPFHLPSLVLCALLLAAFALLLHRFRIRNLWRWTLLLVTVSSTFTLRLTALRPHLLAITLFVLAAWCFCSPRLMKGNRRWGVLALAGLAFGYCYSNPHFILMPVGAYALAVLWKDRDWKALGYPLVALGGVFVALLLHPQFPNSFLIWKLQGVDVVLGMLRLGSGLRVGEELLSSGWEGLLESPFLLFLPLLATWVTCRRRRIAGLRMNREQLFLCLLALGTGIGMCFYYRMAEYGVPAIVAAFAVWERRTECDPAVRRVCMIWVLLAFLWSAAYFARAPKQTLYPYWGLADWLHEKGIPPGTVIGHLSWGDFPQLFYAMPDYRFLCGLDPMFAAGEKRKTMLLLEGLRRGTKFTKPDRLAELIGSRWLWVSRVGEVAAKRLYLYGYVIAWQSDEGWLFKLDEPLHAGKPDGIPRLEAPVEP